MVRPKKYANAKKTNISLYLHPSFERTWERLNKLASGDNDPNFKKYIDEVVLLLDAAFVFTDTPQGSEYWFEVHRYLKAIQARGTETERRVEGRRSGIVDRRQSRRRDGQ